MTIELYHKSFHEVASNPVLRDEVIALEPERKEFMPSLKAEVTYNTDIELFLRNADVFVRLPDIGARVRPGFLLAYDGREYDGAPLVGAALAYFVEEDTVQISVTVAKHARRRGIGTMLVNELAKRHPKNRSFLSRTQSGDPIFPSTANGC